MEAARPWNREINDARDNPSEMPAPVAPCPAKRYPEDSLPLFVVEVCKSRTQLSKDFVWL